MSAPIKLPPAAFGVVFASRVLPGDAKILWEKHVYLDRDEKGVRLPSTIIAQLVGREAETVEASRRRLARLGLLVRAGGVGKAAAWFVAFPGECLPRSPRPSAAELAACGAQLDGLLLARGGWATPEAQSGFTDGQPRTPVRGPSGSTPNGRTGFAAVSTPGVCTEGGVEGGAPPGCSRETKPPRSSPLHEEGRGGVDESNGGKEGTAGGPDSPEWKAAKARAKPAWVDRQGEAVATTPDQGAA